MESILAYCIGGNQNGWSRKYVAPIWCLKLVLLLKRDQYVADDNSVLGPSTLFYFHFSTSVITEYPNPATSLSVGIIERIFVSDIQIIGNMFFILYVHSLISATC